MTKDQAINEARRMARFMEQDVIAYHITPRDEREKRLLMECGDYGAGTPAAAADLFDHEEIARFRPDQVCYNDPDGLHHVGCGCDYTSPDDPQEAKTQATEAEWAAEFRNHPDNR